MGKNYEDYFNDLTIPQCHAPVQADVAWLRMVARHVKDGLRALRAKDDEVLFGDKDRIDNSLCPLSNALVYMEDMIYKSIEKPKKKRKRKRKRNEQLANR